MIENMTDEFFRAHNQMLEDNISAFVEGLEDQDFWEAIFRKYAPALRIQFFPYSQDRLLKNGKEFVLSYLDYAGESLILCIDSDYDYLIKNPKLDNPFVFHTYTHSIENYKVSPVGLESALKKTVMPQLNSSLEIFSFDLFLQEYSKRIYPIFLYVLYIERQKLEDNNLNEPLLHERSLNQTLCIQSADIDPSNNCQNNLNTIEENVLNLCDQLLGKYPDINLAVIEERLTELNISESQLFWYIRGHLLYDCVVTIIFQKLIMLYKREIIAWFDEQEETPQRENKKREYSNQFRKVDWKTLLYNNHMDCLAFDCCPPLENIKADIQRYFMDHHN